MANPYFINTPGSCVLPLARLLPREAPDPARVRRARALMDAAAALGTNPKRHPLSVTPCGNDCYRVVDGNSTFHALLEIRECDAVVEIS
jgi:hypothetical protein